jgi:hypothetical protein
VIWVLVGVMDTGCFKTIVDRDVAPINHATPSREFELLQGSRALLRCPLNLSKHNVFPNFLGGRAEMADISAPSATAANEDRLSTCLTR